MSSRFLCILGCFLVSGCAVLAQPAGIDEQTAIRLEALNRLKGMDLEANPALKGVVLKVLEKTRGTPHFVQLVRDFQLSGYSKELLAYALKHPGDTSGVEAFGIAAAELGTAEIKRFLKDEPSTGLVSLIGNSNSKELEPLLRDLVGDLEGPIEVRKEAVRTLAAKREGAEFLLALAKQDELPGELKLAASSELNRAPWPEVKERALALLPLPQTKNSEPLPPIAELAAKTGNVSRGRMLFSSQTSACSSCHVINGAGTDVGPNLSEIGTKLGKEALYEAILDPSAGISFGYEAWSVELENGDEIYGLITSETEDEVSVKAQNGVVTKHRKDEISSRRKSTTSIMPAGLQLTMSTEELVDLVEYLASLKKAEGAGSRP